MDVILQIAFNIRLRHLRCNRIVIAREDHFSSEQPGSDGQDSRPCPDIEYNVVGLNPSGERFHRHLRGFMCSGTEGLTWIDTNGKTIVGTFGVLPAWNDKEVIADRKTRV